MPSLTVPAPVASRQAGKGDLEIDSRVWQAKCNKITKLLHRGKRALPRGKASYVGVSLPRGNIGLRRGKLTPG